MSKIKTAGDLRGFLADVMMDVRSGDVESADAQAISKLAAQINQSIATEINAALQLERMGKPGMVAGTMLIGSERETPASIVSADGSVWCDQCDARVPADEASQCKSRYCTVRSKLDAQGMAARSDETQGRLGPQGQQPGPKDAPTSRPEAGEGVE